MNPYNPTKNVECIYLTKITGQEFNLEEYTKSVTETFYIFIKRGYKLKYQVDLGKAVVVVWIKDENWIIPENSSSD